MAVLGETSGTTCRHPPLGVAAASRDPVPPMIRTAALVGSVSRRAGGLFDSVRRLCQELQTTAGIGVEILSPRDRFTDGDLPTWEPLGVETFEPLGPRAFGYAPGLWQSLLAVDPELVHLHGLWMYPSLACLRWRRRTCRPVVISAHGMLDPWAMRHSRWKKRFAWALFEGSNLGGASCLRALNPQEAAAIRLLGLRNPICVVPNGVDIPELTPATVPPWAGRIEQGRRVIAYLGRLHPKKNLLALVSAWAQLRRGAPDLARSWALAIVGWDQGGYAERIKDLAREESLQSDVVVLGSLYGEEKAAFFRNAAALVLPSLSEGLPVTVLEAWSYGLPVIMTAACNLPVGFEAGAALEAGSEPGSIAEGLRHLLAMSDQERAAMGTRGRTLVETRFAWPAIAVQMSEVYTWLLGGGPVPACVEVSRGSQEPRDEG